MSHAHKRITAGIAATALALGTAAPAAAMPIGPGGNGTPTSVSPQPSVQPAIHHGSGTNSDWAYLAAGTGVASLALLGIGGTALGRRQRRTRESVASA